MKLDVLCMAEFGTWACLYLVVQKVISTGNILQPQLKNALMPHPTGNLHDGVSATSHPIGNHRVE